MLPVPTEVSLVNVMRLSKAPKNTTQRAVQLKRGLQNDPAKGGLKDCYVFILVPSLRELKLWISRLKKSTFAAVKESVRCEKGNSLALKHTFSVSALNAFAGITNGLR